LSPAAVRIRAHLQQWGACFAEDIERALGLTRSVTLEALWELAAAGLAAADGFDQLRAMIDPARKSVMRTQYRKMRSTAGRWSLFHRELHDRSGEIGQARHKDLALESAAHTLLSRYGVVFRDILARESNLPKWQDLVGMFRRLEDRGIVRGGRFVSGFNGEQFASPEALESFRTLRHIASEEIITIAGADPMNLIGIVLPGDRVASVPGRFLQYQNGLVIGGPEQTRSSITHRPPNRKNTDALRQYDHQAPPSRISSKNVAMSLFENLEISKT
jgi:ATP-dependent Lhr-like helicase